MFGSVFRFQEWDNDGTMVNDKVISDSQVLVGTDNGIRLLDLEQVIDGITYTDINEFVNKLYQK